MLFLIILNVNHIFWPNLTSSALQVGFSRSQTVRNALQPCICSACGFAGLDFLFRCLAVLDILFPLEAEAPCKFHVTGNVVPEVRFTQ
jgi:hypothetical protein